MPCVEKEWNERARSRSGLALRAERVADGSRDAAAEVFVELSETARPRPAPRVGEGARDVGCGSGFEMTRVMGAAPRCCREMLLVGEMSGRMVEVDCPRGRVFVCRLAGCMGCVGAALGGYGVCCSGGVKLTRGWDVFVVGTCGSDLEGMVPEGSAVFFIVGVAPGEDDDDAVAVSGTGGGGMLWLDGGV